MEMELRKLKGLIFERPACDRFPFWPPNHFYSMTVVLKQLIDTRHGSGPSLIQLAQIQIVERDW